MFSTAAYSGQTKHSRRGLCVFLCFFFLAWSVRWGVFSWFQSATAPLDVTESFTLDFSFFLYWLASWFQTSSRDNLHVGELTAHQHRQALTVRAFFIYLFIFLSCPSIHPLILHPSIQPLVPQEACTCCSSKWLGHHLSPERSVAPLPPHACEPQMVSRRSSVLRGATYAPCSEFLSPRWPSPSRSHESGPERDREGTTCRSR